MNGMIYKSTFVKDICKQVRKLQNTEYFTAKEVLDIDTARPTPV